MVTEFQDIICLSVDAESEAGAVLKNKYGVRGYPALLFLNSDGTPRDLIGGYMPTDPFHAELKRIKSGEGTTAALYAAIEASPLDLVARLELAAKLKQFNDKDGAGTQVEAVKGYIAKGEGFDATSIDSRWELYNGLSAAGEKELAEAQLAGIKTLDPAGTSFPLRRIAMDSAIQAMAQRSEYQPLRKLLAEETHEELLYDGWRNIMAFANWKANRVGDDERDTFTQLAREAAEKVWPSTPDADKVQIGNQIAWSFYEAEDELTAAQKTFAVEVAKRAAELSDGDVNVIDTYACCLFMNGDKQGAIKQVRRCLELDPGNKEWIGRLEEFIDG